MFNSFSSANTSAPPAISTSASATLPSNPRQRFSHRSCTECSRRKVRCDHCLPCTNCVRAGSRCIFPTSRRPPTRAKHTKKRNDEVLRYLQRLEDRLAAKEKEEQALSPTNSTPPGGIPQDVTPRGSSYPPDGSDQDTVRVVNKGKESLRLMPDPDRGRYIGNNFWRSMATEVRLQSCFQAVSLQNLTC